MNAIEQKKNITDNVYTKKINWYTNMILNKITQFTQKDSENEILLLISYSANASLLINLFINKYYEILLPEFRKIALDAAKMFWSYLKVPVFDREHINIFKSLYTTQQNPDQLKKSVRFVLSKYSRDITYISSKTKFKNCCFAILVTDKSMISINANGSKISENDYVIVDPSVILPPLNKPSLFYLPDISFITNLTNRKKTCGNTNCIATCQMSYSVKHELGHSSVISLYKNYHQKDECDLILFRQLQNITPIGSCNIDKDKNIKIVLEQDYIKSIMMPFIRNFCLSSNNNNNNYYELTPLNYQYLNQKVILNFDYFYNYYIGNIIKVSNLKKEENYNYQNILLEDIFNEISIDDLIHIGIESVLTYYPSKIDLSNIHPVEYIKGFVMWFLHPIRKEIMQQSQKKYYICDLYQERNNYNQQFDNIDINVLSYQQYKDSYNDDDGILDEIDDLL